MPPPPQDGLLLGPIFQMRKLRQLIQEVAELGSQPGQAGARGLFMRGVAEGRGAIEWRHQVEPGRMWERDSFST